MDRILAGVGGMAKFGNDDGPTDVLFPAVAKFAGDIKNKHLLELQVRKTEVFAGHEHYPQKHHLT